jgi:hypothetical protein
MAFVQQFFDCIPYVSASTPFAYVGGAESLASASLGATIYVCEAAALALMCRRIGIDRSIAAA